MPRLWLAACACACLGTANAADVVSPAPESVEVTIYHEGTESTESVMSADDAGGIGMVTEVRTVELARGANTLVFRGVAEAIVPQTAKIEGLPASVVETNFDYDLSTPGALIAKSLDRHVRIVRTERKTGRVTEQDAILRSGPYGLVADIDGKLEPLGCGGLHEKLVFDEIPPGLAAEPTLSARVGAPQAGKFTIRLSYLALGLNWSADYVAKIAPDGRTLDLVGWITLVNHLSTRFANAPVQVIAGHLSRDEETKAPEIEPVGTDTACWPVGSFTKQIIAEEDRAFGVDRLKAASLAGVPMAEMVVVTGQKVAAMRELGDYKLYEVPEPTTVAPRQSKQVMMLDTRKIPFERVYTRQMYSDLTRDTEPQSAAVVLRIKNEKSSRLGKPLPAGTISVLEPGVSGQSVLVGEKVLQDSPVGVPLEIELGEAIDVWTQKILGKDETVQRRGRKAQRGSVDVLIGNDKPIPVQVELTLDNYGGDLHIVDESKQHTVKYGRILWAFKLAPGARERLSYVEERE